MRLFLLGAPCAGKTTVVGPLREALACPVLDMDEEVLRLNGGTWPTSFDVKRVLVDQVIDAASGLDEVVLAYSLLDEAQREAVRSGGWEIALLDVPEEVLRSRAQERLGREGWSNLEWLPFHLENIAHLRQTGAFTHVVDATLPVGVVVDRVRRLLGNLDPDGG